MHSKRGFTLIELIVVMVIIGILASIVTIAIFNSRQQAYNARVKTDVERLGQAMSSYLITTGNKAPVTPVIAPNGYPKSVDNDLASNIKKEDGTDYGTTLKAIFTKYIPIPVRSGKSAQICTDATSTIASDIGYCYLRYPLNTTGATDDWFIYGGLAYPANIEDLFYGSVSGQTKVLKLNTSGLGNAPKP